MDGRADLVLVADRHLKWPVLDPLEHVLMQLCGVCLVGFYRQPCAGWRRVYLFQDSPASTHL